MNNTNDKTISIIELTQKSYDSYSQALYYTKCGNNKEAKHCFLQGDELLLQVSRIHSQLLSQDILVDLLLIYAEDLLISVQLYKSMIKELLAFYTKFPTLKGN